MRDLQSLIIRSENCAAFIRHFLHDLNLMVLKILVGAKYNNDAKGRIAEFIKDLSEEEGNEFELCII